MYLLKGKGKFISLIMIVMMALGIPALSCATEKTDSDEFKIVGYYSGDLFDEPVEKLQTDKLTHIMYAFLIPNEDGTLKPLNKPEQFKEVVSKANKDGCKVYIALGGWSYEGKPLVGIFEKVAADDKLRAELIKNVVNFTVDNNLDGVEIDWEHPNSNSINNYEKLVVELSKALKQKDKNLTAALNGAWSTTAGPEVSKLMTNKCLQSFEFINVMAYDMNNSEHSPLWFANTSIKYWLNRGVEPENIVLGMPLYARPSWMQYRHLVEQNVNNAYNDYVATTPNESYYNGLNTLREKTTLAIKNAGGVMFFDVNEDVDWQDAQLGKYSVVSEVYKTVENTKGFTTKEEDNYVTVVLNNQILDFNKEVGFGIPFLDKNHRTMIPMRKLLESIGADITWDNDSKTVTAVKMLPATNEYPAGKNINVQVTIGNKFVTVNGNRIDLDTEAVMKDGRTYLPARAVLEAFDYSLAWSDVSSTVYIKSK